MTAQAGELVARSLTKAKRLLSAARRRSRGRGARAKLRVRVRGADLRGDREHQARRARARLARRQRSSPARQRARCSPSLPASYSDLACIRGKSRSTAASRRVRLSRRSRRSIHSACSSPAASSPGHGGPSGALAATGREHGRPGRSSPTTLTRSPTEPAEHPHRSTRADNHLPGTAALDHERGRLGSTLYPGQAVSPLFPLLDLRWIHRPLPARTS